ncbi:unnamed protein product, partial [Mycena citricolor]
TVTATPLCSAIAGASGPFAPASAAVSGVASVAAGAAASARPVISGAAAFAGGAFSSLAPVPSAAASGAVSAVSAVVSSLAAAPSAANSAASAAVSGTAAATANLVAAAETGTTRLVSIINLIPTVPFAAAGMTPAFLQQTQAQVQALVAALDAIATFPTPLNSGQVGQVNSHLTTLQNNLARVITSGTTVPTAVKSALQPLGPALTRVAPSLGASTSATVIVQLIAAWSK